MADWLCYVRIHPPLRLIVVGNGPPIDIGLTSHVPMRDNALRIGHNPVLFDVLRDDGMVSDIFDAR